jgi:hypothetical protein
MFHHWEVRLLRNVLECVYTCRYVLYVRVYICMYLFLVVRSLLSPLCFVGIQTQPAIMLGYVMYVHVCALGTKSKSIHYGAITVLWIMDAADHTSIGGPGYSSIFFG